MKLELVIGRSKTGKSTYIYDQINKRLKSNNPDNLLLIVPEQTTYSTEFDVINRIDSEGIMDLEILSFKRLTYKVFEEVGGLKTNEINDYGRIMLLKQIFDKNYEHLKVYKKASKQEGFLKEFNNLIRELKENNISYEFLKNIAKFNIEDEVLKRKMNDIVFIYESIENRLSGNYFDEEDKIKQFIELIEKSKYIKNSSIWIDNFDTFTGLRFNIIEKFLEFSNKVTIVLNLDSLALDNFEYIDDWESFKISYDTFNRLIEISKNLDVDLSVKPLSDRFDNNEEIYHLEKNFFTYNNSEYNKQTNKIEIISSLNPYSETEKIAIKIISHVRDNNYRWKDINVAVGDMKIYEPNIKKVFTQFGIPFFIDAKRNIMDNPLIKFILSIMDMLIWNFKFNDVFEYLKSGFTDFENSDIEKLENFALRYGIEGSKWFKTFDFNEENIEYFEELRKKIIQKFEKHKNNFKYLNDVENISIYLFNILQSHNVINLIEKKVEEYKKRGLYEVAYENTQIWNVIMDLFDQLNNEIVKKVKITPLQYRRILEAGFNEIELGIIPPTIDRVGVGSIDRGSTKKAKILFVMGTNEGVIPSTEINCGMLLDEERETLVKEGVKLLNSKDFNYYKEKNSVYKTISKPEEFIYFSYSVSTIDGKPLQPSIYIDRLKLLFPKIEIDSQLSNINEIDLISNSKGTTNYIVEKIRDNFDGKKINGIWKDTYGWYDENDGNIKNIIESGLLYNNKANILAPEIIGKIYKAPLNLSVSKLESFAECPFKFFVENGLKPIIRKEFKVEYYDIGDIFHKSVEEFTNVIAEKELEYTKISNDDCKKIMEQSVKKILQQKKSENIALEANARNMYLKNKIKRLSNRAAKVIVNQVSRGNFRPTYNEIKFSEGFEKNCIKPLELILETGEKIYLVGRVDRIDILSKDNHTYVNIIDYKSGNKDIDLTDFINGLQMQLFIYMDAVLKNGEKLFKSKPEIGGVFYFNIDDPILNGDNINIDEIDNEILKKLSLKGYTIGDLDIIKEMDCDILESKISNVIPVKLNKNDSISKTSKTLEKEIYNELLKKAEDTAKNIALEILSGVIDIKPYKKNNFTPCLYCEYKSVCQFDPSIPENNYKVIKNIKKEDITQILSHNKNIVVSS